MIRFSASFMSCLSVLIVLAISPAHAADRAPHGTQEVDILWIVDNSGSTDTYRASLGQNVAKLFERLTAAPWIDWKMGLISTDSTEQPYLGFNAAFDRSVADPTNGLLGALVRMGSFGSGIEETFTPVVAKLMQHSGFLRPNAFLAIIVVTDAQEQSQMSTELFLNNLAGLKSGLDRISFSGVIGARDLTGCDSGFGETSDWMYAGSKYEAAIQATGGRLYQLCKADWPVALSSLHDHLVERLTIRPQQDF